MVISDHLVNKITYCEAMGYLEEKPMDYRASGGGGVVCVVLLTTLIGNLFNGPCHDLSTWIPM